MGAGLRCGLVKSDPVIAVGRVGSVPTILRVITEVTGLRLSLIAHVTEDRWTCCAVNDQLEFGLSVGGELDVATTLCSEVRRSRIPIVISHASVDAKYHCHPTPRIYGFESCISVPIHLRSGEYFGNVCAFDSRPLPLDEPKIVAMFQLFAELVGLQIDAEARHEATSRALLDARATAELREQFIAVLGHDLRTPLGAISLGAEILTSSALPAAKASIVQRIGRSVDRMARLIDDVLDFARGRLGEGIPLQAAPIADVAALFRQVIDELQAVHPGRPIAVHVEGEGPMHGDPVRLSQLLQNLLANALVHSPEGARVAVTIGADDRHLVLSVSNGGPALPAQLVERMFEPYQRGTSARPAGLGLGLYIAAQIVRSHRGTIDVESNEVATTITCRLPRSYGG